MDQNCKSFSLLLKLLLMASLLAACASKPKLPTSEEQANKLNALLENGGYQPDSKYAINTTSDIWRHEFTELEIVITTPSQSGRYPLIIYLPSLGEDANAGKLWREAWAKAGYAVVSVQPLAISQALKQLKAERNEPLDPNKPEDDAEWLNDKTIDEPDNKGVINTLFGGNNKKPNKSDRSSDIRYLGHEYFATANLKDRLRHFYWVYQQLKTKINAGLPIYNLIDINKLILVGYDLGAQTVAGVLGESFMTSLPENPGLKPIAAILLSPSIDLAEGNIRNRFKNLTAPMLVITSSDDDDPYAISSGSVRSAVWEFSPPDNKFLLLLTGTVHSLLAGSDVGGRYAAKNHDEDAYGNSQGGRSGGRGRLHEQNNYGGNSGGRNGSGGRNNAGFANNNFNDPNKIKERNAELGYKQVAAVISTSNAFLDIITKNDEFARFWIMEKANKWLDRAGSISLR